MFMCQDEELILASAPLDVLISGYERASHRRRKQQIAISMAIRLYDGTCRSDAEEARVEAWLRTHRDACIGGVGYDYVSRDIAKRLDIE